jgi:phenylalanyl-tRNA synthetase beta chain
LHPTVQKNYDLKDDVYYAEINLDMIENYTDKKIKIKPVSKFPIVERDIAIVVAESKTNEELSSAIKSACGKLFYSVELFDVYRSENIGKDMKSLAYKIKLSDSDKTLTEQDVQAVINKVLKSLEFRCGARLR